MWRLTGALALAGVVKAAAVVAQDAEEFVRDNVLAIFYHEFGHALIDLRDLPIYGQEEDAADVASVMLMDALYEEETAVNMVMSTADAFWADAAREQGDLVYWGLHGLSEQRYFNTICIFFGGNPDGRQDMIDVMGLPQDRAETCAEEYEQADHSWGSVFRALATLQGNDPFVLDIQSDAAPIMAQTLRQEVAAMNQTFGLQQTLPIEISDCGEANAFYDPARQAITMCTEFEDDLKLVFEALYEEN